MRKVVEIRLVVPAFIAVLGVVLTAMSSAWGVDPVAWYTFNEGSGTVVVDHSGRGNNGVISGTAVYQKISPTKYALLFNGIDTKVNYGNLPLTDWASAITAVAWVKVNSDTGRVFIFGQPDTASILDNFLSGIVASSEWTGTYTFVGYWCMGNKPVYGNATCLDGNWHHVATVLTTVLSSNKIQLWVDGVKVHERIHPGYINNTPHKDWVSGFDYDPNGDRYFNGAIQEARLYEKALTSDQIIADYQAGPTQIVPPISCAQAIQQGYRLAGDLNSDCRINFTDFAKLAMNWLLCNDPVNPSCLVNWPG
jgi:hypothetical protein